MRLHEVIWVAYVTRGFNLRFQLQIALGVLLQVVFSHSKAVEPAKSKFQPVTVNK